MSPPDLRWSARNVASIAHAVDWEAELGRAIQARDWRAALGYGLACAGWWAAIDRERSKAGGS